MRKENGESLKAGIISRNGFMGSDQRPLAEIIRADDETVKELGLTHPAIAEHMEFLREAGKSGAGEFVSGESHFEVACEIARGFLSCPFGDASRIRKTNVTVRNLRLRKKIVFSELNIHLIAAHGFYEGKGSPFRLEPADLAQTLEIGGSIVSRIRFGL